MFIIISGIGFTLNNIIFYIIYVHSILYIFYRLVFTVFVIKQWIFYLCTGKFIVRNSLLDPFSTLLKASMVSIKTLSTFTIGTGMTYALCHELDDLLEKEGKEPYFVPGMKNILNKTGLGEHAKIFLNKLGIKDRIDKSNSEALLNYLKDISNEEKKNI